jgi:hypothetical protein
MQVEILLGMTMLGRSVIELLLLGFGLGLLGFVLTRAAERTADFTRTVRLGRALLTGRWQESRSRIALVQ